MEAKLTISSAMVMPVPASPIPISMTDKASWSAAILYGVALTDAALDSFLHGLDAMTQSMTQGKDSRSH